MSKSSLQIFTEETSAAWGPLTSELVGGCCARIETLLKAQPTEPWLASLQRELPEQSELYRDPAHGFLLLAHAEERGRFRPPHDHGRGWVIYGVQQGEMEIRTYARVVESDGQTRLVLREAYLVQPGEVRVYLPGDIHDTRCTKGPVLYYRFTDRDLRKEESQGHAMTRYVECDGGWRVSP
ncbi:MAG TPA: hypothetical protein VFL62_17795 [Bradyrhizobium sp.]|uniref:hypothetical protein n=1 Tax=Bradyrhizobium sp. TaxID=376 RepID=UPI002D803291|nr:hypothetical protein [Bradyrhizobium sp.]HET7888081.1 hypothetical protein [Bradyrhizobium sp.]